MTCRLAAVQLDLRLGDVDGNLQAIADHAQACSQQGASLVVFPECAMTGYCFDSLDEALKVADSIPGSLTDRLAEICRQHGVHLITGMLELDGQQLRNASVLVGPDGLIGHYRKTHLPFLGVDRFASPGDAPFQVWETPLGRIGMLICYDLSFPEPARVMAVLGADLIVLPTNWPPGAELTAEHVVASRSLENRVFCAAVNRVGTERGFRFIGGSRICDPDGNTLVVARGDQSEVLWADLALDEAREKRIVRVPDKHIIDRFADRRPELYGPLVEPVHAGRYLHGRM